MTKEIFYESSYIKEFEARIIRQDQDERGNYVVLTQTAFYPTGGGQPHDTGLLDEKEVFQVEEIEGVVRHYLSEPIKSTNEVVQGVINWERRFDHMQQHAAQHILSAAFAEIFGYETVSFHLGAEHSTIDLAISSLTSDEVEKTLTVANQIILDHKPIETKWMTVNEANAYPLRKQLSVSGDVRLVIIPDVDYNGCGGTHPNNTSEVQGIAITGWEKQRQHIRVSFLSGKRVFKQFTHQQTALEQLTQALNAPIETLPDAASEVLVKIKQKDKEIQTLKEELLIYEAKELATTSDVVYGQRLISCLYDSRPMSELQQLARKLSEKEADTIVALFSKNGEKLQLVVACGALVEAFSANSLLKELLSEIDGRGGGNNRLAQGGGNKEVSVEILVEKLKDLLNKGLRVS
ncbi:alanyl-tRNA editing protein [Bacillus sp. FJAT-45037]|uniref:alanyl-tRNA editing protein n=1 Tax=Bacillus sp. FJAT-45037 TaxID=2011007 RepID=UPI000C2419F8|nr:DHHA1 domain-containing protein [Bacillus sp. FJAT-45037]